MFRIRKKAKTCLMFTAAVAAALTFAAFGEALTEEATEGTDSKIATAEEMTKIQEVEESWMIPILPEEIANGVYEIEVNSSSSMFPITDCLLIVSDDHMEAIMTMSGTGYLYVYPGTPKEAVDAPHEDYIPYEENAEGDHTFTFPVEALDAPVKCAAFSKNKEKWYDRSLVFLSTDLPEEAFLTARYHTVEDLGLADGTYTVEVTLNGGTGKAYVESPALLTVEDGEAVLTAVFSSAHYDYVLIDGVKYKTVNEEGNSTFRLPIDGFDYNMPIIADTTAMSKPHEIDYALFLDSSSIQDAR